LIGFEKLKLAMSLVLLSPHIPLLFMGEEAAVETPFLFFADWSGEAAELTRQGRRREFSHFKSFSTTEMQEKIPDPCDEQTFAASKLDWQGIDTSPRRREFRDFTRELLELRKTRIVPLIKQGFVSATGGPIDRSGPQGAIQVCWRTAGGHGLQLVANLADEKVPVREPIRGDVVWQSAPLEDDMLLPSHVVVSTFVSS
jgi:maltooligosyltrehalose trehalohydrolase